MSREFTKEEERKKFLEHIKALAKYWANVKGRTVEEQCDGVAFSILVMLDGGAIDIPAYAVIPAPHPEDKQYNIDTDENYHKDISDEIYDLGIGAGMELHHEYAQMDNKEKKDEECNSL